MAQNIKKNEELKCDNIDGSINFNLDVISTITSLAINEIDGISEALGSNSVKKNKNFKKNIKVDLNEKEVSLDISLYMDYGIPIHNVANEVQNNIKKSLESMTGLVVKNIDIHILDISFSKESSENNKNISE